MNKLYKATASSVLILFSTVAISTNSFQDSETTSLESKMLGHPIRSIDEARNIGEAVELIFQELEIKSKIPMDLYTTKCEFDQSKLPLSAKGCLLVLLDKTEFKMMFANNKLLILNSDEMREYVFSKSYDLSFFGTKELLSFVQRAKLIVAPHVWEKKEYSMTPKTNNRSLTVHCNQMMEVSPKLLKVEKWSPDWRQCRLSKFNFQYVGCNRRGDHHGRLYSFANTGTSFF